VAGLVTAAALVELAVYSLLVVFVTDRFRSPSPNYLPSTLFSDRERFLAIVSIRRGNSGRDSTLWAPADARRSRGPAGAHRRSIHLFQPQRALSLLQAIALF